MTILSIGLAGVVATFAMTVFTGIAFRVLNQPYHVILILANMICFKPSTPLTARPHPHLTLAIILHFAIGILSHTVIDLLTQYCPADFLNEDNHLRSQVVLRGMAFRIL